MAKSKSCIVCGNPAGSKEHVFPAALGGRRTNSGIYCTVHDNSYSGLVAEIANQIDFINAYLGVRPDHSTQIKSISAEDKLTGQTIVISAEKIKFAGPRLMSAEPKGNGTEVKMAFPDRTSLKQWVAEIEGNGYKLIHQSKPTRHRYLLDAIHHRRAFGGELGLGAVAYVTQTFFAQEFPEIARSGALENFIGYTQAVAKIAMLQGLNEENIKRKKLNDAESELVTALIPFNGSFPAWWDFEPNHATTPNAFAFGHRVIVGVDGSDGQLYGRLSLFSTLNFSIAVGAAPSGVDSCEVMIDIDPLAEHPPKDMTKIVSPAAKHIEKVLENPSHGLADAIASGMAQQQMQDLLKRLTDYQLKKLARDMAKAIAPLLAMPSDDARTMLEQIIDEQSQQVWRATTFVVEELRDQLISEGERNYSALLEQMIAHDAGSLTGLSHQAEATLTIAKGALAAQIEQDLSENLLSEDRIADLMGRGPGLHIIGTAVLAPLLNALNT